MYRKPFHYILSNSRSSHFCIFVYIVYICQSDKQAHYLVFFCFEIFPYMLIICIYKYLSYMFAYKTRFVLYIHVYIKKSCFSEIKDVIFQKLSSIYLLFPILSFIFYLCSWLLHIFIFM